MCEQCDAFKDTEPLRFYGGPVDGTEIRVPRHLKQVRVPALLASGYAQAVYERHELTTGAAMVCEGSWPLARAYNTPPFDP